MKIKIKSMFFTYLVRDIYIYSITFDSIETYRFKTIATGERKERESEN